MCLVGISSLLQGSPQAMMIRFGPGESYGELHFDVSGVPGERTRGPARRAQQGKH